MHQWNLQEFKAVMEWANTPESERPSIKELAYQLSRSPGSVREFLRRILPHGQRPWPEKPRWNQEEIEQIQKSESAVNRSEEAVRKFLERHRPPPDENAEDDQETTRLSEEQIAQDLGLSRNKVRQLVKAGVLRRFKGGIAESTFDDLVKNRPDLIPYQRLDPEMKAYLVILGYPDRTLHVKHPSTRGLIK